MTAERRFDTRRAVEFLLMLAMFGGLIDLIRNFVVYGYIPLPFVYDVSDTFMDWFNPAYWGHNGHAYGDYTSVYAPLSFVITDFFSQSSCYGFGHPHPKDARGCDMIGISTIIVCYILCFILASIAFHKEDRSTALYRSVGFGIGLPMLYALERGNLIMIAIIFFIFFFAMAKSRAAKAVSAALMINMKSYLLLPVLVYGIKRDWRKLELCGFATIAVYLVTLTIYGSGTPFELINNLKVWFNAMSSVVWDQISYSTTYAPFLQFDAHQYPVRDFIPDRVVTIITAAIKSELIASRGIVILCIGFAWLYPKSISTVRLAFFLLAQSFVVDNPGGYAQSLLIFLVFLEKWSNWRIGLAIISAYLISIPTDILFASALHVPRESWLSGREVQTVYGLTIGALVRPGLILVMVWSLAIDSLIDIHRAIRQRPPRLTLRPPPRETLIGAPAAA